MGWDLLSLGLFCRLDLKNAIKQSLTLFDTLILERTRKEMPGGEVTETRL